MLDLNIGILSTHSVEEECNAPISLLNEEEAFFSGTTSKEGFISFDILKREDNGAILPRPPPDSDYLSGGSEWLNLSLMQQEMATVKKTKSRRGPKSRSSHYRGVTFYRRTGRWESHIWDCGKQVYLGGFDTAYIAARVYDRAAIKFRGLDADINFIVDDYKHEIEKVKNLSKEELVQTLRRESSSLARRGSKNKDCTPKQCNNKNDHIHLFQNRGCWSAVSTQCNEMRKIEGDIKLGAYNKGNEVDDLELRLGISSTSKNIESKTRDNYLDMNHSLTSLYGKPLPVYLPMIETKPLKTMVASSSGFPFIAMLSSSSLSTCFDP